MGAGEANILTPQSSNFLATRLDHDFGPKWHLMASYRYYSFTNLTSNQVDIGGVLPGDTLGVPKALTPRPQHPWPDWTARTRIARVRGPKSRPPKWRRPLPSTATFSLDSLRIGRMERRAGDHRRSCGNIATEGAFPTGVPFPRAAAGSIPAAVHSSRLRARARSRFAQLPVAVRIGRRGRRRIAAAIGRIGGRAVDRRSATFLKQHIPNAELITLPGVGHIPSEEVPEEFNRIIWSFFA